jgi:hypothetical protein
MLPRLVDNASIVVEAQAIGNYGLGAGRGRTALWSVAWLNRSTSELP